MTLSPVFRSQSAVALLAKHGVWERLAPDMEQQARAVRRVYADFEEVVSEDFRREPPHIPDASEITTPAGLRFLQEYFFLVLFRSIFAALGIPDDRLQIYTELNFCIKGTVTAADNLFDDQAKTLLPLADHAGPRFLSILQLMAFERLMMGVLKRAAGSGVIKACDGPAIQRSLMDRMAAIGILEGSEEGGVDEVPDPDRMIDEVHRVRGGRLFALAFGAPAVLEVGTLAERLGLAAEATARLGTAFQIVDDLTDFEVDVGRRSHNLLVAQIWHEGTEAEKTALAPFWAGEAVPQGVVEQVFATSARSVLHRAYREAHASFSALSELGHWFNPALAEQVVHAIVGLDGVTRMDSLTSGRVAAF